MTFMMWLESNQGFAIFLAALLIGGLMSARFVIKDFKKWDQGGPAGAVQGPQQEPTPDAVAQPSADQSGVMGWRPFAAKAIGFATAAMALLVLYQVVRFWQGEVGAPGWDQFIVGMQSVFGPPDPNAIFAAWFQRAINYLGGTVTWVVWATLVSAVGATVARIVEVGFAQYAAECKEAAEAERRLDRREARRERRREMLRSAQAEKEKRSTPSFALPLVLGIIIGKMF